MPDQPSATSPSGLGFWFLIAGVPLVAVDVSIMDVLLAGLIILIGGSLTTGLADGLGVLIAGRIAQGAAFAMVLTTVIAMLNRDYPQGPARARGPSPPR